MTEARPWTLNVGCSEWSDSTTYATEDEARDAFDKAREDPPSSGLYTATSITLENPDGEAVSTWDQPTGDD